MFLVFFLVGDYAKGIDSGVIEVIIEGPALNQNYIENIIQRIKKEKKEVIVYSTTEYVGDGLLVLKINKRDWFFQCSEK